MQFYNFIIYIFMFCVIFIFCFLHLISLDCFQYIWITNISWLAFWASFRPARQLGGVEKKKLNSLFRCWWCVRVGIKKYGFSDFSTQQRSERSRVLGCHWARDSRIFISPFRFSHQKIIHSLYVFWRFSFSSFCF